MDEYFMNIAIKQAKKAYKNEDVPVGAVIVKDNKVIAKAYNKKEKYNNSTKHAEILVISQTSKKIKNWRLEDCTLYVTMEPCMMCCGAILQSRIKKVVYGIKNENYGYSKCLKNVEVISGVCEEECKKMVQSFFKKRR